MTDHLFRISVLVVSLAFMGYFVVVVVPPLIERGDVLGAFAAGFANPYSSGYSADVIGCWFILAAWVLFEARAHSVRGGWICLALGVVPGVVVGFAAYLLVRSRQISEARRSNAA